MASKFIPLSGATSLKIVVIYPGVGYGTQRYVESRLEEEVLPSIGSVPVLVVIPALNSTQWSEVVGDIYQYAKDTGLSLHPGAIVGWSGGARGVGTAISAGHDFPEILLADPSPLEAAFADDRVRMWYQPANWKGSLAHLGPRQERYAEGMGNRAELVDLDHNEIFDLVATVAITEQASKWGALGVALAVAVPGSIAILLLIWAIRRRRRL